MLRDVQVRDDGSVDVTITPTYSGCPAMQTIEDDVRAALRDAGHPTVRVSTVLSPAWSTDWMSEDGRRKLREYGIAPPNPTSGARAGGPVPLTLGARPDVVAVPAVRVDAHHGADPVRLDVLQGAVAVRVLPGAVRPLQGDLMTSESAPGFGTTSTAPQVSARTHASFNPLRLKEIGQLTNSVRDPDVRRPGRAARGVPVHPRSAPDPADHHRRRGGAAQLLDLRGAVVRAAAGGREVVGGRGVLQPRPHRPVGRRRPGRDDPGGAVRRPARPDPAQGVRRDRRRQRDHPGDVDPAGRARDGAAAAPSPWSTATGTAAP